MKKVRKGLYIGDASDAITVRTSETPPVSYVLSLVPDGEKLRHPEVPQRERVQALTVPLLDVDSQNLLDNLEACFEFIEKGREGGNVLVHCVAGVSRRYL